MILPHFDLEQTIRLIGIAGVGFVTFAESGLFFGFFLPGDSLLFTAGLLASQGFFSIWILAVTVVLAAVLGDNVGYWTGRKLGGWLMRQKDTFFFKKKYIHQAQTFYEKHGAQALILARFVPIVRTFAPIVAGMAEMNYEKFFLNNIIGGTLWALGMTVGGYFLGRVIPNVDKYLLPIIGVIVVVSLIPAILHLRGEKNA